MNRARKFFARLGTGLAQASLLSFATACTTVENYRLTHRVWDTDSFRKFSEPAPEPNLALFQLRDGREVLVQYDACSEANVAVKRRAYQLRHNWARAAAARKPRFVDPSRALGLPPILVLKSDSVNTNAPPELADYAVAAEDGRGFTLYQSPGGAETHSLPIYRENSGTAMRVALTPFAVAGDTVRAAEVVAVLGIIAMAQSGAYWGTY